MPKEYIAKQKHFGKDAIKTSFLLPQRNKVRYSPQPPRHTPPFDVFLHLIERIDLPQTSKATFKIIDHRPRREGLSTIRANARTEVDIMIDRIHWRRLSIRV